MISAVRLLPAFVDLTVGDLTITEGIDQAKHSLETPPLSLAILFLNDNCLPGSVVSLVLALVALSISLTSILDHHCTLASCGVHQVLECIALPLLVRILLGLQVALSDLSVVFLR
jgi:hypothetical protein